MKRVKVISYGSLPVGAPVQPTILMWLLLDRLQSPDIVRGIVYTLVGILWLGWLLRKISEEYVDIFKTAIFPYHE